MMIKVNNKIPNCIGLDIYDKNRGGKHHFWSEYLTDMEEVAYQRWEVNEMRNWNMMERDKMDRNFSWALKLRIPRLYTKGAKK